MILLVRSIFLLLISSQVLAKTLVVSDIDDTIRSLNVRTNYLELFDHATDERRAFRGMVEIFTALDEAGAKIYYVSAVVEPFVGYSIEFLSFNQFPQDQNFFYKGWFEETYDFKLQQIRDIIDFEKPDAILLFGDNADKDVAVYGEIRREYANVRVFIHKVYPEAVPSQQNIFLTSADLAVQLESQQWITSSVTEAVFQNIQGDLESGDDFLMDLVWPHWGEASPEDIDLAFSQTVASDKNQEALQWLKEELFK